mgnify:FL=1
MYSLIDKLEKEHKLELEQYEMLIEGQDASPMAYAAKKADKIRRNIYNNDVYIRGLIEISNVCRNNCYYCGIRRSSGSCQRYTLTDEQILKCCRQGHDLGFRTFVLQGGEGALSIERILGLVRTIKSEFPDCAVTLSLGEYEKEDYRRMYAAGADRYLLRHETADEEHYKLLHPAEMSFSRRMQCLRDLKSIGFQTGCGFMVGSPYQKARHIAEDLKFIEEFRPDMCGIGPFIPQKDTPFKDMPAGRVDLTVYLLSLIRLIQPNILLPATTALGSIQEGGREKGIMAGANVVMPNLSPLDVRGKYAIYDNKLAEGAESAQSLETLKERIKAIGYRVVCARGDIKNK